MIIGDKTDFDDRSNEIHDVQNIYYGRDRGEKDQGPRTYVTSRSISQKVGVPARSTSIY
jgi:hypothetical protein